MARTFGVTVIGGPNISLRRVSYNDSNFEKLTARRVTHFFVPVKFPNVATEIGYDELDATKVSTGAVYNVAK